MKSSANGRPAPRRPWSGYLLPLLVALLVLPLSPPSRAQAMPGTMLATMASDAASQAFPNPGACTRLFRAWRAFHDDDAKMDVCLNLMGINQYCAAHDSFVAVGYDRDQTYRYLVCAPYSHPDSVGDQFVHLATGIAQGVADAFIAAVPFVGAAVSGVACVYGQIYACAVLALEISDAAGVPIAGVAGEAIGIAADVPKCSDGDLVSCAKIGVRGARVAGLTIPGKDPAQVADDAKLCDDGDFAACMRLGKSAADAGGVPPGLGNGSFVDAQDCLAGNNQACTVLGKEAAAAQAPMGGIPQGAQDLQSCAGGNNADCTHLGKSLASLTTPRAVALGRVQSTTPPPPLHRMGNEPMICARARDARARNSPAAPSLTAQCQAAGGDFTERAVKSDVTARSVLERQSSKVQGIQFADPPICARARDARSRNSPAAPSLETQCRAAGGTP
ncbi:hypothetical protein [Cognatiluteimonas profundi]|uniref:hypothetical protein n=1 Tax=Cognatiluteimonas profundi TaxID=2594501 RepID=UPI00131D4874|nr:hypothetical protein [Lysobacter profundi]